MRFDEPDTREAYRRGARDLYESIARDLARSQVRNIEAWLEELETWQEFDPPPPPLPSLR
jgi:hypothetical protein